MTEEKQGALYFIDSRGAAYLAGGMQSALGPTRIESERHGDRIIVRVTQEIDESALKLAAKMAVEGGHVVVMKDA